MQRTLIWLQLTGITIFMQIIPETETNSNVRIFFIQLLKIIPGDPTIFISEAPFQGCFKRMRDHGVDIISNHSAIFA